MAVQIEKKWIGYIKCVEGKTHMAKWFEPAHTIVIEAVEKKVK